jgi:hypothetical protein
VCGTLVVSSDSDLFSSLLAHQYQQQYHLQHFQQELQQIGPSMPPLRSCPPSSLASSFDFHQAALHAGDSRQDIGLSADNSTTSSTHSLSSCWKTWRPGVGGCVVARTARTGNVGVRPGTTMASDGGAEGATCPNPAADKKSNGNRLCLVTECAAGNGGPPGGSALHETFRQVTGHTLPHRRAIAMIFSPTYCGSRRRRDGPSIDRLLLELQKAGADRWPFPMSERHRRMQDGRVLTCASTGALLAGREQRDHPSSPDRSGSGKHAHAAASFRVQRRGERPSAYAPSCR